MPSAKRYRVDLEPVGRRAEITAEQTLLEAAQQSGVELVSLCGGIGACDSCKVRLIDGKLTPHTIEEESIFTPDELAAGWRLACQAEPLSDVKLDIPPESLTTPQRLQLEGVSNNVPFVPAVTIIDMTVPPPTLHDLRADVTRLHDILSEMGKPAYPLTLPAIAALPDVLRTHDWSAQLIVRDAEIVAVLPPESRVLGFAVDIGTTGVAAYLVDMTDGAILGKTGAMNPQIAYGEDVISRIVYINDHAEAHDTLQKRLVATLNDMIITLCEQSGIAQNCIVDVVAVGNTAMHHIFAGLPVRQLGEAPYLPVMADALEFPVAQIGLMVNPGANIYLPPNVAGYVGADHVSMLLATGAWQAERTTVAIDIGTNTEVTLVSGGEHWSCSCASGPAFEGAHIRDGMRAAPGAIERVQLAGDELRLQTIGGRAPVGICGSGILDAIATLAENDLVDRRGVFKTHPLIRPVDNAQPVFVLADASATEHGRAVTIGRKDIAEIQLAKAAIRAGIDILLNEAGISAQDIDDFVIAGAFGTYINVDGAVAIGMFPDLPSERFRQVGNAAGMGAVQLLISKPLRQNAADLVTRLRYVELTTHQEFQARFMDSMGLVAS